MTDRLLAKSTGETIACHTIWCLRAAKALLDSLPVPEDRRHALDQDVLLALAVHDLGKAASGFQQMVRGERQDWNGR